MIALDAMGGDYAPQVAVLGAINAAKKGIPVCLFGDQEQLKILLDCNYSQWQNLPLSIQHCSEIIRMEDEPSRSVLKKQDASLVRAVKSVAQGMCQAVVSAGNSGAAMVAGTLILERMDGVMRPALAAFLPTKKGEVLCLDLGANSDCKPEYLYQFAYLGHAYACVMKNIVRPRIALLSNGAESTKGSLAVKEAHKKLLQSSLNFVGNLEARYVLEGDIDVLVCDGFAGNVLLKGMQGTARTVADLIVEEGKKTWWKRLCLLAALPLLRAVKTRFDYQQRGGALLCGVKQPLIVAHGSSNAIAIERALIFAHDVAANNILSKIARNCQEIMQSSQYYSSLFKPALRSTIAPYAE